jgi:hypothetical protein
MSAWSRSDVLALLGIVVALLTAALPPVRRAVSGMWYRAMPWFGYSRSRYRRWFSKTYRVIYNIYLDRQEKLDLHNTFVSLSISAGRGDGENRAATRVIGDSAARRLLITGDPGTGKSTLLKAYGLGTMRSRRQKGTREFGKILPGKEIPFYIPLRRFAKNLGGIGMDLRRYISTEILERGVGLNHRHAERFLRHLLERHLCVVLLDGLDEVHVDRYHEVRDAIYRFIDDKSPAMPTSATRVVLTCRQQNFLAIQDEWIPAFTYNTYTLCALRDVEIFRYLENLRGDFEPPQSPETFINAVGAAGTLDLHRIPLVLAMSVGLFLSRKVQEVPSSVNLLYEAMVKELLARHDFRIDPPAKVNRFKAGDKYKYLRDLAFRMAGRQSAFQDFSRADLLTAAKEIAPQLNEVKDEEAEDFVTEILDRSGLISRVSEEGTFTFAHRSIQEFLAAQKLQRDFGSGARFLISKVSDSEWHQVTLFFAGGDQPQLGDFLTELSTHDNELAVLCLANADVSDDAAAGILASLSEKLERSAKIDAGLVAMLSATRSPRRGVRELSIAHVERVLQASGDTSDVILRLGGDADGTIRVLADLAGANTAKIAALVPRLAWATLDDPRLVGPLWRCLTAPGIEAHPACREIVSRLLTLAMDEVCFDELQRQLPFVRDFITEDLRRRAYPFDRSLPLDSNLVTLLAWAEYLEVVPERANRFFQAKAAGPRVFNGVEAALRRTIQLRLHRPMTVVATISPLAAMATIVYYAVRDAGVFLRPFGWWSLLLFIGPPVLTAVATFIVGLELQPTSTNPEQGDQASATSEKPPETPHLLGIEQGDLANPYLNVTADYLPDWLIVLALFGIAPLLYGFALAPVAGVSVAGYIALAVAAYILTWHLSMLHLTGKAVGLYVYRPNRYVDMYSDPASRHWLIHKGSTQ